MTVLGDSLYNIISDRLFVTVLGDFIYNIISDRLL